MFWDDFLFSGLILLIQNGIFEKKNENSKIETWKKIEGTVFIYTCLSSTQFSDNSSKLNKDN